MTIIPDWAVSAVPWEASGHLPKAVVVVVVMDGLVLFERPFGTSLFVGVKSPLSTLFPPRPLIQCWTPSTMDRLPNAPTLLLIAKVNLRPPATPLATPLATRRATPQTLAALIANRKCCGKQIDAGAEAFEHHS